MALSEFELIERYFTGHDRSEGISLGVGDDCALLTVPEGRELAVTTDSLCEDVHFFKNTEPYLLGYKTLAVNVSDLLAMGAEPYCCTLSLILDRADEDFLAEFARGFYACAAAAGGRERPLALIGGNVSRGALSFTVTAFGLVPAGRALRRSGALPGDKIFVTGTLGLPGLAVELGYGRFAEHRARFPELYRQSMLPRLYPVFAAGLRGLAGAAVDISDGLTGDLGHVLERSGTGAELEVSALPYDPILTELGLPWRERERLALGGGGDYQLLFTVPEKNLGGVRELARSSGVPITQIGEISGGHGLILKRHGVIIADSIPAYEHF